MDVDMYRGKVLVPSPTLKMLKGKGRGLFMHSLPPPLENFTFPSPGNFDGHAGIFGF